MGFKVNINVKGRFLKRFSSFVNVIGKRCFVTPLRRLGPGRGICAASSEQRPLEAGFQLLVSKIACRSGMNAALLPLLFLALPLHATAQDGPHLGLAYDDFRLTLAPGERTEVLGPLFYDEERETQHTWAFPPLLSYSHDPGTELKEFDFAYPILTYDSYGKQYRWQFLQLLSLSGGESQTETNRNRFTIFPIYFQQRSSDPNENYTALLPIYGHLKHRLMRDEIFFVLFPLYSETRKKDVVTDNYLYPFFHLRHGDGLKGWQFWPLYGQEHKQITHLTNGFGDVKLSGGHDKMFVLWPFYWNQYNEIGMDNPQHTQGCLPFYDFLRSPKRDLTTVIWPLFTWINDREKKYREWQMPWPIVDIARGEGKHTTRFFPLFQQSHSGSAPPFSGPGSRAPRASTNAFLQSDFYLWPIYKYKRVRSEPLDRERTRILFFLYSDTWQKNTETGESQRRRDFWPFYTYKNDYNGNSRLQILALLEPLVPGSHKIERDYSPVWSLWRSENNPREHASSQSLLWNLYRHQTSPETKYTSALFGLFQHRSDAKGKTVRLFYIPIYKRKSSLAAPKPLSEGGSSSSSSSSSVPAQKPPSKAGPAAPKRPSEGGFQPK